MKKIRHLTSYQTKDGRTMYRILPPVRMRDAGFRAEKLGDDRRAAIAKVEQINA